MDGRTYSFRYSRLALSLGKRIRDDTRNPSSYYRVVERIVGIMSYLADLYFWFALSAMV